jgi:TonB family protein
MNCTYCGHALTPFTKFCTKCGNPAPQPEPAAYTPPNQPPSSPNPPPSSFNPPPGNAPPPSWGVGAQSAPRQPPRRKSRAGKILLIVFSVLVVLGVGAGAAIYFGYQHFKSSIKSSEAYRVAEDELKRSSRVAEKLGEIKETGFPIGTYKEQGDGTGNAAFTVSVVGTKASGRYFVTMDKERGAWRVTNGFVKVDGEDEPINVVENEGNGSGAGTGESGNANDDVPPPPPPPGAKGRPAISGGVLNGKAISKPEPPYPAIAKAARAQGAVTVQVEVNEQGQVVSANAVSGHPLLRASAVAAARQAKFTPTLLAGKPVKVSGVLTYNFKLE